MDNNNNYYYYYVSKVKPKKISSLIKLKILWLIHQQIVHNLLKKKKKHNSRSPVCMICYCYIKQIIGLLFSQTFPSSNSKSLDGFDSILSRNFLLLSLDFTSWTTIDDRDNKKQQD